MGHGSSLDGMLEQIPLPELVAQAGALRDAGHDARVTYSRKAFVPLTQLCRDSCHYCTFAQPPREGVAPYMDEAAVLEVARQAAALGCKEVLFTLGDRPETRYGVAAAWLEAHGYASTLHYVADMAKRVVAGTGLLPHINAGVMTADEIAMLRPVSASMGLMLETAAERLCAKGGPHYGSPDKRPEVRLRSIAAAGALRVPFTTGLLVGIGETRAERIEALLAVRTLHRQHGHIQEIIIQNFVPKQGTRMAAHLPASLTELIWTIAVARILFGAEMSIQAPPNLAPGDLGHLIEAGINDWGGVSPLTPDYVNPEKPWPEIAALAAATALAGKTLCERLTIYPAYARNQADWLDPAMRGPVYELSDCAFLGREDSWRSGRSQGLPAGFAGVGGRTTVAELLDRRAAVGPQAWSTDDIARLFEARGEGFRAVCEAADQERAALCGDAATYVVNRNINYTNICGYSCHFCAFSKGSRHHDGAERPYLLEIEEIVARVAEARARGGTEVCLQGGIHPSFTGDTYLSILRAIKRSDPAMHVHAFSPLEIWHGATSLGRPLRDYLMALRDEGLGSLPGTAAEILHDPVRAILCPDKLNTAQWLEVVGTAHEIGLHSTATIMFGHVDGYFDWAIHLDHIRRLQARTGGFTEFVPLPFVAHEAPLYKRGRARPGPTAREAILMHAVARLVLSPAIVNIQASWVKLGAGGMRAALAAGANDLGGTLMNESITRAAGATHGQEMSVAQMCAMVVELGRKPTPRTTLYASAEQSLVA